MNISRFDSIDMMTEAAMSHVLYSVNKSSKSLICAATGSSPTGLYRRMSNYAGSHLDFFSQVRVLQLDEWVGLGLEDEGSCGYYLDKHLIQPLRISQDRYFAFKGLAADLQQECRNMQEKLDQQGPIDICILGVGKNGHLGFNEPADQLQDYCHVARLKSVTQRHGMVQNMKTKPTRGLTLGMKDILSSRYIMLLVAGSGKEEAFEQVVRGSVNNDWPVTHLLNHDNTDCFVSFQ